MNLTPKQEKFALTYFETGNASEAYRQAYNCQNMESVTINSRASELLKNSKIKVRLKELNSKIETKTIMDKQNLLEYWSETVNNKDLKDSDRLKASELLAKHYQMFVDKQEHSHTLNGGVKKLEDWFAEGEAV